MDNEACLRGMRPDFNECYEDFKMEIINTPWIKTCINLDFQESCMTDAVKDCGESAVSWTRGFRRYVTRYLDRGHKCGKSDGYESGSRCTVEGLHSCLLPLSAALDVEMTSFLDLVQASPAKVMDMCNSDIKEDALACWENMIDGCKDNTILAHGLAYIGAVEHLCGEHMQVFADKSECLATMKPSFETCVGKFFWNLDKTDRDDMCTKVEGLDTCMTSGVQECGKSAVEWTEEFYNSITKFIQNIFMCNTQCQQSAGATAMDRCVQNLQVKAGLNSISPDAVLGMSEDDLKFMCRDKYLALSCAEGIIRNCKDDEKQGMMTKAYMSMLCDKDMRQNFACVSAKAAEVQGCYNDLPKIFTWNGMGGEDVCSLAECVSGSVQECGSPATSWLLSVTAAGYGISGQQLATCSAISHVASLLTVSALFVLSKLFFN